MNKEEILALNVRELKAKLAELGLNTSGRKAALQDKLFEAYNIEIPDDEDDDVSVQEDLASRNTSVVEPALVRSNFTLRDIEDSLNKFSGSGYPSVKQWVEHFEENAMAVRWDSLQMFIYAKQLLKGAARIFVRSQEGIDSWNALRRALLKEFGTTLSAVEVHRRPRNRRRRAGEDYKEYLYSLMELGKQINLDEVSIIEYFIEGIPDSRSNKANLYLAKNVKELKDQIRVYEKISSTKNNSSTPSQGGSQVTQVDGKRSQQAIAPRSGSRCFKCGDMTHFAKSCPNRDFLCFKCGRAGHRASDCKGTKGEPSSANMISSCSNIGHDLAKSGLLFKDVCVNGRYFSAMIDTGSDLCLLRHDTLFLLCDIELSNDKRLLRGIRDSQMETEGSFTYDFPCGLGARHALRCNNRQRYFAACRVGSITRQYRI
ncbi:PREDICTED: uncharacterized protein LOC108364716 [Rhagoletis zephyria]|uniref:uncharacterized protein LOC108364716 n=1 Tax=Rhagoletis zephyria TaxID=28612 RepID=UPI0008113BF6|nr:PREDICTED: uncharacterized protein LOC108364716 [Rhagoletis zephyria]